MQPMAPLHVGVVEHQARALAAELEQEPLHGAARRPRRCARRPAVDPVKLIMSTSGDSTRAAAGAASAEIDQIDHSGREPHLVEDAHQLDHGQRVLGGGLHHDGVAHGQRGRHLAGHVDEREVVRGDAGHHAHRLADGQGGDQPAGSQRRGLGDLQGQGPLGHGAAVAGIAVEAVGRDRDLHARPDGGRGARLGDDERQQVLGACPDGRGGLGPEQCGAVLGVGGAPSPRARHERRRRPRRRRPRWRGGPCRRPPRWPG